MAIKSILCIFDGNPHELNALDTAMLLAQEYAAQLRILHLSLSPYVYGDINGEGIVLSGEISAAFEEQNSEQLARAQHYAADYATKHQIPLDAPDGFVNQASARFLHFTGPIESVIAREGRLCDLNIISRNAAPLSTKLTPALFNTGRPVLLIPSATNGTRWRVKTVVLAWNSSLESARALWGAMPLLQQAGKLYVLMIHPHAEPTGSGQQDELMHYLHAHNLAAELVVVGYEHHSSGQQALSEAKKLKADLLVMGAYGHSMFREKILGGFTEYMLNHADIPLILSH